MNSSTITFLMTEFLQHLATFGADHVCSSVFPFFSLPLAFGMTDGERRFSCTLHVYLFYWQSKKKTSPILLSSQRDDLPQRSGCDRGIGDIVQRYLASGRCDGVFAHHRERVRKAVAAFFSAGHSLDTLVVQLVGQCYVYVCRQSRSSLFSQQGLEEREPTSYEWFSYRSWKPLVA